MDFYEPAELERVLARSAGILGIELGAEAGAEIACRSWNAANRQPAAAPCARLCRGPPTA